jgi:hypothetical protein
MKATLISLGTLLLAAAPSFAQSNAFAPCPGPRRAPDACGPCFYCTNYCGAVYGPNYCVRPPFPPYNGVGLSLQQQHQAGPAYPMNPYTRSPRDFFMLSPRDNWTADP